MNGYIKLHRKLLENCIAKEPEYLAMWVTLLMMANHQETTFIWNNKKQTLSAGQLLTGRKQLAEQTGISESKVYRILKYLENEQQIEQQKSSQFTIISIKHWGEYQQSEQQNEQRMNNKRTTNEQRVNTYKNEKNEKNEKNNIYIPAENEIAVVEKKYSRLQNLIDDKEQVILRAKELYPDKNVEKAIDVFISKNQAKNYGYKNYMLAFFNWVREDRYGEYGIDNGIAKNYGRPRLAIN